MSEITDQFKLIGVRLSFPDIWTAKAVQEGGEPKFGCSFLLDKEQHAEQIKAIKSLIVAVATAKFGEKLKELREKKKIKYCLHEGSEKTYDGYGEENMYLTASSSKRPLIIDRDRSALAEEDGRPYAGCYVNGIVRLWVQDNNFGKRVNAELKGLQFAKEGEPFGSDAPATPNDFDDISEGEEKAGKKAAGKKAKAENEDNGEDEIEF